MELLAPAAVPDPQVCEQARITRDPRFDGWFFTAVTSTRIYCRPVCPVPTVKQANVRYYASAAAAEAAGFRPCLICRPELAPGAWRRGDALLARALKLIDEGLLDNQPLAALAARVGTGERQLRRLFVERLGASPRDVHITRRLLFAKQLLTETSLPVTEVALEAGFGSLRRFNASFRRAYRMAPTELRKRPRQTAGDSLSLRLDYRPPYDFGRLLEFLRARAIPGLEAVDGGSYARLIGEPGATGWLKVSACPGREHALNVQLHCARSTQILKVAVRLRRMFDLDADPAAIRATLAGDERLRPSIERFPGLRLAGGWDGFEVAVRAVLGRLSGTAARQQAAGLVRDYGHVPATASLTGLDRLFPTAEVLADADADALVATGLTRAAATAVLELARACLDGRADFRPEQTLESFVARWSVLPGIDARTAHYIALRALGHPDAFPADERILRALAGRGVARALEVEAQRWRPWRAYAVTHLWLGAPPQPSRCDAPLHYRGGDSHQQWRSP